MRTIQLRRYTLVDGEYDAFLAWWEEWMPRVRPATGFAIEFAYGLRETNEFVWAVSAEGDQRGVHRDRAGLHGLAPSGPRRSTACRSGSRSTTSASSTTSGALRAERRGRTTSAASRHERPAQPPIADRIAAATRVSRAAMSASGCGSDR